MEDDAVNREPDPKDREQVARCAYCKRELPHSRMKYCPSCKTLAYRRRKAEAVQVLRGVGQFTEEQAKDVVEKAGMKKITELFTSLGLAWSDEHRKWAVVNRERWRWYTDWLRSRYPNLDQRA